MTAALTRARSGMDPTFWQVRYGDVPVGSYGRAERRSNEFVWQWAVGFYPGCRPDQMKFGQAQTEDAARDALRVAWEALQPQLGEEQFEDWRQYSRRQAWMLQMRAKGRRLPTMNDDGKATCFCGSIITNTDGEEHIRVAHGEMRA